VVRFMRRMLLMVGMVAGLTISAQAGLLGTGDGGSRLDVTRFPPDMKPGVAVMNSKCIDCHTLNRVINAIQTRRLSDGSPFGKSESKDYGIKKMRKPGMNLSKEETKAVIELMDYLLDHPKLLAGLPHSGSEAPVAGGVSKDCFSETRR